MKVAMQESSIMAGELGTLHNWDRISIKILNFIC